MLFITKFTAFQHKKLPEIYEIKGNNKQGNYNNVFWLGEIRSKKPNERNLLINIKLIAVLLDRFNELAQPLILLELYLIYKHCVTNHYGYHTSVNFVLGYWKT
jgi:hypothetical protein